MGQSAEFVMVFHLKYLCTGAGVLPGLNLLVREGQGQWNFTGNLDQSVCQIGNAHALLGNAEVHGNKRLRTNLSVDFFIQTGKT